MLGRILGERSVEAKVVASGEDREALAQDAKLLCESFVARILAVGAFQRRKTAVPV